MVYNHRYKIAAYPSIPIPSIPMLCHFFGQLLVAVKINVEVGRGKTGMEAATNVRSIVGKNGVDLSPDFIKKYI